MARTKSDAAPRARGPPGRGRGLKRPARAAGHGKVAERAEAELEEARNGGKRMGRTQMMDLYMDL